MKRPIALWLRETRLRQVMPNGDPWTQDYLLAQMQRTIGWAPYRPNYSKYEQPDKGSVPNRDTLAKFIQFWATKGEPGPDLAAPAPEQDPVVAAMDRQTDAIKAQTDMLRAVLIALGTKEMSDETRDFVERAMAPTQSLLPTPDRPGTTARS